MRVLFVSPYIPSRIRVRPYQWLRALVRLGHSVHLVALKPPEDRWAPVAELQKLCAALDVFDLSRVRTLQNMLLAVPGSHPLQVAYSEHPEARRRVRGLADSGRFDVVHVEHLRAAGLAWQLRGTPRVFDAVDSIALLFDQASRLAPRLSQRLAARFERVRTREFERRAVLEFDRTVVTSEADALAIRASCSAAPHYKVAVVPNGVDLDYFSPTTSAPERATILFSGKMSYHANAATALHLARHIMPLVWREEPDARLIIAGKDPPTFVQTLGKDTRILVTGYVDDLRPFFRAATLMAAPLAYGAGIQNKVLEAMASGVPVVTTRRVADALVAVPGRDFFVAATDADFAAEILRIVRSPDLRRSVSQSSRAYVERQHDWTTMAERMVAIYHGALNDRRQRSDQGVSPMA